MTNKYYKKTELAKLLKITDAAVWDACNRGIINAEYGLIKNDRKCKAYIEKSLKRKRYNKP